MSQKNKKNQIIMRPHNQLLHLTDKSQILNTFHHKDSQLVTLNIQLKDLRDHFPKINICQLNLQLARTEDSLFSKTMNLKDIKSMIREIFNNLLLTKSRIFSISKNMMSHMNLCKLLNTLKMWNQPIDMIQNKTMNLYLQDLKSLSIKEDQFLQSKDPNLKASRTTNKLKKTKFRLAKPKLHKSIYQDLQWDLNKKPSMSLSTNIRDQLLPSKILNPFSF